MIGGVPEWIDWVVFADEGAYLKDDAPDDVVKAFEQWQEDYSEDIKIMKVKLHIV